MPIYMKFEGIKGSATGSYQGWIELESAQMGTSRNVSGSTGGNVNRESGVPSITEIVVTKLQDNSSTHLFREALSGSGKKVIIDFVRSGECGAPYLSFEMENTLISNFSISGHGGDSRNKPVEFLSLNFTKISFSTKPTACPKDPQAVKDRAGWNSAIK